MVDPMRFGLNSYGYFRRWAEYAILGCYAVACAAMLALLAFELYAAAGFTLAIWVAGWLCAFLSLRGLRNPDRSYVALGATSFELVIGFPFRPLRLTVPYSQIEGVLDGAASTSIFLNPWPYPMRAWGPHVEVHLRNATRVPLLLRFPPYVQVIHLSTERLDELARELRARVSGQRVERPDA